MIVSAPQRVAHTILSTSSSTEDQTAEFPMLALIFTRKFLPMIIGSVSGCLRLAGITARPRATSSRTNSGVQRSRAAMNSISRVITPAFAQPSWVLCSRPSAQPDLSGCSPLWTSMFASGSV